MKYLLTLLILGCSAPTLAQRQDAWRQVRDTTRAECLIGKNDPAMPDDVRDWCERTFEP